jgi:DNA/RNA endonuclease YhcR with UshA esterase domain
MRLFNQCPLLLATMLRLSSLAWPECLPVEEARKHIGEIKCITGKVVRVQQGTRGVHFLDFCDDFRLCPFTVVIFPSDLKNVGDVRQLDGRLIEIHGQVKEYDGRAEIILEEYRQLSGSTARIPPLPKNYDVEKKGRYSAGTFSHPKAGKKASKKRQTAKLPIEVPEDSD